VDEELGLSPSRPIRILQRVIRVGYLHHRPVEVRQASGICEEVTQADHGVPVGEDEREVGRSNGFG